MEKCEHGVDERRSSLRVADGGRTDLDRILDAISRRRSRYVLYCLQEREPRDFDTVVRAVIERETEIPADQAGDAVQRRVCTDLYHNHLPKLADLKIIEYDDRSGAIRYRNPPPVLDEYLSLSRELE